MQIYCVEVIKNVQISDTIQEQQANNIQISYLKIGRKNCSFKCSYIVQTVLELNNSYKVVALVDADRIVSAIKIEIFSL